MPWTLPGPILAFLQAGYSWQAAVVNILTQFVIPGLIWYPAFKAWERIVIEKEGLEAAQEAAPAPQPTPA
jgi:PTS system cellobiose-specific IIC component